MLKKRAICYYKKGCNCSQCVLCAARDEYGLEIPDECCKSCEGIYNGLGIGSVCSVLIGCIMVIGLAEKDVSFRRLDMTEKFNKKFGSINCGKLKNNMNCCEIIGEACDILENILTEKEEQ